MSGGDNAISGDSSFGNAVRKFQKEWDKERRRENRRSQIRCFTFGFRPPPVTEEEPSKCEGCSECDGTDDRSTTSSLLEQERSTEKESPGERKNCPAGNHCHICDKPLFEGDASGNDKYEKDSAEYGKRGEYSPCTRDLLRE